MSELTEIIIKSGILSPEALREVRKWGLPVGDTEVPPASDYEVPMTPQALSTAISEAVESQGYVVLRETDLEAVPQYLSTMKHATLHVVADRTGYDIPVQVGRTKSGEWLMPWASDSITDLLTNGETYLRVDGKHLFFGSARELFYGTHKAFVSCKVSTEVDDGCSL